MTYSPSPLAVTARLVRAVHVFAAVLERKAWMARIKRVMTVIYIRALLLAAKIRQTFRMKGGWVYIVTNKRDGILYVGVTSDMRRRASEHRDGTYPGFSKRHGLKRLVYMESHDEIESAIARETRIKKWPRAWKVRMIHGFNPDWDDLYETLNY